MKTKIALLLLLVISFTGVVANENVSISDNVSDSMITSPTDSDVDNIEEEEKDHPHFEAIFAIVGLLAIAYFVVRQRTKGT